MPPWLVLRSYPPYGGSGPANCRKLLVVSCLSAFERLGGVSGRLFMRLPAAATRPIFGRSASCLQSLKAAVSSAPADRRGGWEAACPVTGGWGQNYRLFKRGPDSREASQWPRATPNLSHELTGLLFVGTRLRHLPMLFGKHRSGYDVGDHALDLGSPA